jgi:putative redox protein
MKAIIKQVNGCSFVGKADSNHWVSIDTSKDAFGSDASTHPIELVLLALGSCSGCDVVYILNKKKVVLQGFEINIDAERSETDPKVFTKIHLEYVFYGKDVNPLHVERAITLSLEKYCPVYAMLKDSVSTTSSYKIIEGVSKHKK